MRAAFAVLRDGWAFRHTTWSNCAKPTCTSADYIAVGPIFPTATKENPDPVVGLEFLRAARQLTQKPLVAIGGITIESAADVFRAGADSVAVIRDLLAAPNPAERAREYLAIAERARARQRAIRTSMADTPNHERQPANPPNSSRASACSIRR